jgi:ribosomal protein L7Ae-like RNA K-turn-binding protein
MKPNFHHKLLFMLLLLLTISTGKTYAQETETPPTLLSLKYFLPENKVPYINVITKKKIGRKFEPVPGVTINVYLTAAAPGNLLGKVITASNGEGRIAFPPALKASWDSLDAFTILAESVPTGKEELLSAELPIKKAILIVDTINVDGVRNVTGLLKEKKGTEYVTVGDIEMKLRIKRLLGNLTVGEAETYTSDSSGVASAEFKKDSMPGDEKGNIILVARVEDNDIYGNLVVEKSVPWGKPAIAEVNFWHRTLWSTGNRAPIWLLAIAFSIILGVWGTIFYLVKQVFKIRKMGKVFEQA